MNLNTLAQGEPWMTPEEQDLNRDLIHAIANFLKAGGVPETAFTTLRVNDITATWLLARRLELALAPQEGEPPPCPTPAQADAIGKCRERLRKAIKELEEDCAQTDTPVREGLADEMLHVIQKVRATGLVEEGPFGDSLKEPYTTEEHDPDTATQSGPAAQAPGESPQAPGGSDEKQRTTRPESHEPPGTYPRPNAQITGKKSTATQATPTERGHPIRAGMSRRE